MFYRLWRLTVTLPDICQCYLSLGVTRAIMGTGEQQKLQRLAELEVRIKDLDVGVKSSQSETAGFIQSVNQQLEQFEWMKNREIGMFCQFHFWYNACQGYITVCLFGKKFLA